MHTDLSQVVAEKMQALPIEKQQKVLEFVEDLAESRQTIWEKIDERVSNLSAETLEKLPTDGAENLDHYLYGVPKK
jgi:uncharacterized protein YpbB